MGGVLNIEISLASADSAAVTINGFTTSTTRFLKIYTTASQRATTLWSDSKYRYTNDALYIYDDHVTFDGVQFAHVNATGIGGMLSPDAQAAGSRINVLNCHLKGYGGSSYTEMGVYASNANTVVNVINSVFSQFSTVGSASSGPINAAAGTVNLYNCVCIGGYRTVSAAGGTINAKNTYAGGNGGGGDFYRGSGTLAKTNCVSSDTTASATGTGVTASNCLVSKAINTTNFVSTSNFDLPGTGSALYHVGVPPGGSDPLNYSTDIHGDAYDGTTPSVGADEYVAAASGNRRRRVLIAMSD
jgi:hypothetical protein